MLNNEVVTREKAVHLRQCGEEPYTVQSVQSLDFWSRRGEINLEINYVNMLNNEVVTREKAVHLRQCGEEPYTVSSHIINLILAEDIK